MRFSRRGVSVVAASKRDDQPEDWQLKYLYDGGCTVCNSLVKLLKSKKGHEKIWCVHAPTTRGPRPFTRPSDKRSRPRPLLFRT